MIALYSVYLKPVEEVDRHLEGHRAFIRTLYDRGVGICSGPQVPRNGGFILMNVPGKSEAMELMKDDPYVIHRVAAYMPIEFEVRSSAPGFEALL
ncbi:MAG TPA: YciI family protein [Bacteroidales bacterium]|nr:YciI family protein [Bacteroidales bacterium]HPS61462.1 YciI family protein [Bacteroidales bacterium]